MLALDQCLGCKCTTLHKEENQQVHVAEKGEKERKVLCECISLSNILKYILHPQVNDLLVILSLSATLSLYSSGWMCCVLVLIGLSPPVHSICMQMQVAADFITSSIRSPGGLLKFHLTANKKYIWGTCVDLNGETEAWMQVIVMPLQAEKNNYTKVSPQC